MNEPATCHHKFPLYPIGLTGVNSIMFRCEFCGEVCGLGDDNPSEKIEPSQAVCNFCGGQLKLRDKNQEDEGAPKYVCLICGNIPFTPDPPPLQSKVAMSYNVTPTFRKE